MAAQPFVAPGSLNGMTGFWDGRGRRLATALLAPALLLAACGSAPLAAAHPNAPAAETKPRPPRPKIVARGLLRHRPELLSVAYGHGSLWLAFSGDPQQVPGRLVRISAPGLRVTGSWPVPGSPSTLAVGRRYVWVGGDFGGGYRPAYLADRVQQFTLGGALVHSYRVGDPVGLAAAGDSAWIEYDNPRHEKVAVRRLADGTEDKPVPVTFGITLGPSLYNSTLATCPDGVYAASISARSGATAIDRITRGRRDGTAVIGDSGNTVLSCAGGSGVLSVIQDAATVWLRLATFGRTVRVRKVARLPGFAHGLGADSGAEWIELDNYHVTSTRIWLIGARSFLPGPAAPVVPAVALAVPAGNRLWVIAHDNRHPDRWLITGLAGGNPPPAPAAAR
jgi:hypothetical protein